MNPNDQNSGNPTNDHLADWQREAVAAAQGAISPAQPTVEQPAQAAQIIQTPTPNPAPDQTQPSLPPPQAVQNPALNPESYQVQPNLPQPPIIQPTVYGPTMPASQVVVADIAPNPLPENSAQAPPTGRSKKLMLFAAAAAGFIVLLTGAVLLIASHGKSNHVQAASEPMQIHNGSGTDAVDRPCYSFSGLSNDFLGLVAKDCAADYASFNKTTLQGSLKVTPIDASAASKSNTSLDAAANGVISQMKAAGATVAQKQTITLGGTPAVLVKYAPAGSLKTTASVIAMSNKTYDKAVKEHSSDIFIIAYASGTDNAEQNLTNLVQSWQWK